MQSSDAPTYLTEADHPWLRELLAERERFTGLCGRQWRDRTMDPLFVDAPRAERKAALRVLARLTDDTADRPLPPRKVRAVVFRAAALSADRRQAIARAAASLAMAPALVESALFADVPDECQLGPLREPLSPADLAVRANALLGAILTRSKQCLTRKT